MSSLLVVTGEASGDAWAADVVRALGVPAVGIGGRHLSAAGAELSSDLATFSAMGVSGAVQRAPAVLSSLLRLRRVVVKRRPRVGLLVGFSEVNTRLAPWLRARGLKVLWYAPPQVWAWRPWRARRIARDADALAVVLPFEESLWRAAGARAHYVGHPALDQGNHPAQSGAPVVDVVVLPGSRGHEVRAHLSPMLGAVQALRRRGSVGSAAVVLAPSLDGATRAWVWTRALAAGVVPAGVPLPAVARGARVALAASGTATLECAALGLPPVIVYRTDALTYGVARRLVRVPHIGLPNLVLGREAFPELLQGAVTAEAIARAARVVLGAHAARLRDCEEVRARLASPTGTGMPSERVAAMLASWLS